MKYLAAIFVGALAATVLTLVVIARRGAPAPLAWDEPEDGVQPSDPRLGEVLGAIVEVAETWHGVFGNVKCHLRNCPVCSQTDWPAASWVPRTAELATGGGQEGPEQ